MSSSSVTEDDAQTVTLPFRHHEPQTVRIAHFAATFVIASAVSEAIQPAHLRAAGLLVRQEAGAILPVEVRPR